MHVILERVTITPDVHVCVLCGQNAFCEFTSYEPVTQEHIDTLQDHLTALWPSRDMSRSDDENILLLAQDIPMRATMFLATYAAQSEGPPAPQRVTYQCPGCTMGWFFLLGIDAPAAARLLLQMPIERI